MPPGGAFVRQRHNTSGYSSSGGEELDEEDSAGSPMAWAPSSSSSSSRINGWCHHIENLLWVASAAFIFYYGDLHSNFFSLLLRDSRIRRTALNLGLLCVACDTIIFIYLAFWVRDMVKVDNRWEISSPAAILTATVIGLLAFFLLCLALWPIWRLLTLPLLFTLFMAFVVISPYIPPYVKMKPASDILRLD
ncbi:hypothetical protein SUGI_0021820 [Cryptomeria japonica]|nr:uncharacterized protein LOC131065075 isoform X2 [Cryptomeria japonica]GLJ05631.1 hypothetical protein SUGI_0021820 [Cryptomeria japonica]